MAFSSTIAGQSYQGQIRIIYGTWSGLTGDTAGSMTVGGYVLCALFFKTDPSTTTTSGSGGPGGTQSNFLTSQLIPTVQWSQAIPGTITIQNQDNVANGGFLIFTIGF